MKFVVRHEAYDMVKGNVLWKMMEEKKICGGRTWQSMKEHFFKKILPAIETFQLNKTEITKFTNMRIKKSITNSDKQSRLYTKHPDGQEDQCNTRNKKYYTEAEDHKLLQFIIKQERYKSAGGVKVWKLMERRNVLPDRSWQSMKERYRKVLSRKLEEYLPSDVAIPMQEADLEGTKQRTKKRKALPAPHSLSPQIYTQMAEPAASVSLTSSACLTKNCTNLSSSTNRRKRCVGSKVFVVTGTPNKKDSIQNLTNGELQGIENSHKKVNINSKKKKEKKKAAVSQCKTNTKECV